MSGGRSEKTDADAVSTAVKLLARRPLTRSELTDRLIRAGHDAAHAERAVERLEREGVVDDARLARQWIEVRSVRLGYGIHRLRRELEVRGVDEEVVRNVARQVVEQGDVEPLEILRRSVEKRIRGLRGRRDRAAYARMYNAMLRAGHEPQAIRDALAVHFTESGDHTEAGSISDET